MVLKLCFGGVHGLMERSLGADLVVFLVEMNSLGCRWMVRLGGGGKNCWLGRKSN